MSPVFTEMKNPMVRVQAESRIGAKTDSSPATLALETWVSPLAGGMPIHFGDGSVDLLPGFLETLDPDKSSLFPTTAFSTSTALFCFSFSTAASRPK